MTFRVRPDSSNHTIDKNEIHAFRFYRLKRSIDLLETSRFTVPFHTFFHFISLPVVHLSVFWISESFLKSYQDDRFMLKSFELIDFLVKKIIIIKQDEFRWMKRQLSRNWSRLKLQIGEENHNLILKLVSSFKISGLHILFFVWLLFDLFIVCNGQCGGVFWVIVNIVFL